MRIPADFLNSLKSRLSILDVISRYVSIVKKGTRYFVCCPFHSEKTPSFHINTQSETYYCFGCKEQGDIFSFIQKIKNVDFIVAVELLAQDAGLPMPEQSPEQSQDDEKRHYFYQIMQWAQEFFTVTLQSDKGISARNYMQKRKLTANIAQVFQLGYALDTRNALKTYLLQKNVSVEDMKILCLVTNTGDYDFFRGRLIFPIFDRQGRVIAFGGRTLGDDQPKYLNSSETPLYTKGYHLYGYVNARNSHHKDDPVIIVEGYTDVLSLYQYGFDKTVAPLGTAFTAEQINLVWRLSNIPIMCFDGDNAGIKAAQETALHILSLLKPGYSLRFLFLSQGEDPDTYLQHYGEQAFRNLLADPMPLSQFLWDTLKNKYSGTIPEQQAEWHKQIDLALKCITDQTVRNAYYKQFQEWGYGFQSKRYGSHSEKGLTYSQSALKKRTPLNLDIIQEKILIGLPVVHPMILEEIYENFSILAFKSNAFNVIKDALIRYINENNLLEKTAVYHYLISQGFENILKNLNFENLVLHAPALKSTMASENVIEEWTVCYMAYTKRQQFTDNKKAEVIRHKMLLTKS